MDWKAFYREIQEGTFRSVYLFSGPEEHLKRKAVEALEKAILPAGMEEMNRTRLEGADAQRILEAAETIPFLAERRMVIVTDFAPLLSGKSKSEESEAEKIAQWLKSPPNTVCLIFYMRSEPDGRKKLTGALKKSGAEVRFESLSDSEIAAWAKKLLRPLGKELPMPSVARLTFIAGRDLNRLAGEMEKLIAFTGDRREIQPEDISKVVSPSPEYTVFEMMDKLLQGDVAGANRALSNLLYSGQSRMGILAMLLRQVRSLCHMALALQAGGSAASVEKQLGLHPYAAKRIAQQCRGLDAKELEKSYLELVESDFSVKSGLLRDRDALDFAMLKIGEIRRNSGTPARKSPSK
ncbi:MAG TPA: DNA polymerase III subunit delta [Candidatus Pullichristensenella excrementigallinarum]|uniref:DNA polymerase III subunit delta n=1 Tax=Candidatus Pullichristensenella excrementigallinarum TaxID=2840907 RepID=A0A9D1IB01_9FIRM|nr:DNA polymerase III subunit delta [Candidatus Pullichristensenella excrementigallinarum]